MGDADRLLFMAQMYTVAEYGKIPIFRGKAKCDDGGRWMPAVFKIGTGRFRAGVIPLDRGCGVISDVVWVCENLAALEARNMARIAAA